MQARIDALDRRVVGQYVSAQQPSAVTDTLPGLVGLWRYDVVITTYLALAFSYLCWRPPVPTGSASRYTGKSNGLCSASAKLPSLVDTRQQTSEHATRNLVFAFAL